MQNNFFELSDRYNDISKQGDNLEKLNAAVNWEIFRSILESVDQKERKSTAGRKVTDRIVMFKMLILQQLYNLSDDALEYAVLDRLSFSRFIGVELRKEVPDAKTVWAFRELIKEKDIHEKLFNQFEQALLGMGVKLTSGQMVDATFVHVPIQRNTREENAQIKAGQTPQAWQENPAKLSQKDTQARWTKKGGINHYGYKNHINADYKTKLITKYAITPANVHDCQELRNVLRPPESGGENVWGDSAFRSEKIEEYLVQNGYTSKIHKKGYKNSPLTEEQKESNRQKSKKRSRVEHVFGAMKNEMSGKEIRTIGEARAKVQIALKNLAYNLKRAVSLIKIGVFGFNRIIAPAMM